MLLILEEAHRSRRLCNLYTQGARYYRSYRKQCQGFLDALGSLYLSVDYLTIVVLNSLHCANRQQLGKLVEGIEDRNTRQVVEQPKTRNQGASDSKLGYIKDLTM